MLASPSSPPPDCRYGRYCMINALPHHLLSHVNDKYLENFQSGATNGDEFDSYQCLDDFPGTATQGNKRNWRWDPCHIDEIVNNTLTPTRVKSLGSSMRQALRVKR